MELIQVGIFVFIRTTAFMVISPVFSQKGIPALSKVIISAALMLVTVPLVPYFEPIDNLFIFALVVWKEVLFGLIVEERVEKSLKKFGCRAINVKVGSLHYLT